MIHSPNWNLVGVLFGVLIIDLIFFAAAWRSVRSVFWTRKTIAPESTDGCALYGLDFV